MLCLKRIRYFDTFIRDTVDGRIIAPGEYYYEDIDLDTGKSNGTIISAEHYWELKEQDMRDNFDESYYNMMESEYEYKKALREAERAAREKNILKTTKLEDMR